MTTDLRGEIEKAMKSLHPEIKKALEKKDELIAGYRQMVKDLQDEYEKLEAENRRLKK